MTKNCDKIVNRDTPSRGGTTPKPPTPGPLVCPHNAISPLPLHRPVHATTPEHTSFSDQHAQKYTNGRKCICYLNNVAQNGKMRTASGWNQQKHLRRALRWEYVRALFVLLCYEYLQSVSVFGCVASILQRISVFGCVASICSACVYLVVLQIQRVCVFGCFASICSACVHLVVLKVFAACVVKFKKQIFFFFICSVPFQPLQNKSTVPHYKMKRFYRCIHFFTFQSCNFNRIV